MLLLLFLLPHHLSSRQRAPQSPKERRENRKRSMKSQDMDFSSFFFHTSSLATHQPPAWRCKTSCSSPFSFSTATLAAHLPHSPEGKRRRSMAPQKIMFLLLLLLLLHRLSSCLPLSLSVSLSVSLCLFLSLSLTLSLYI